MQVIGRRLQVIEKKLAELQTPHNGGANPPALGDISEAENGDSPDEEGLQVSLVPFSYCVPVRHLTQKQSEIQQQPKSRVKVVLIKMNPETGEPTEVDTVHKTPPDIEQHKEDLAFILHKKIKEPSESGHNYSEIDITNPDLWALLKAKLGHYPYHIYCGSTVTLTSLCEAIVFQFDELVIESQKTPENEADSITRGDLKLLLDAVSSGSSGDEKLDKYFKMRPNYKKQEPETIQFEELWTIFPPGALVYGEPFRNQPQVFIANDNRRPWPWQRGDTSRGTTRFAPWELEAWSCDWREGTFCRCLFILKIDHFDGHLPLTSLPFHPFQLHPDFNNLQKELIKRGKDFRNICEADQSSRLFDYKGKTIFERKGLSDRVNEDEVYLLH
jgi:hypothetical protein